MRYCTGCGEACWSSLRRYVSLIDLLCFFIALFVCVHWDKKDLPHLMTKVCPHEIKFKISSEQLKDHQRQTLTSTKAFIYLICLFCPTLVLVTKVSLYFWEVILKFTAQQNKIIIFKICGENHLEVIFEGSCDTLNISHRFSKTQVQTGKCCRETDIDAFMCDSIVHVYRYTVILSYTVTSHD